MEDKKIPDEENRQDAENNKTESEKRETSSDQHQDSIDALQQKKLICSLAYIFGILFFLPLLMYPKDEFAKFHANQSLVILLVSIVGEAVFGILTVIRIAALQMIFSILCGLFGVAMLVACILAILGVVRGEKYELPIIGQIKLLK